MFMIISLLFVVSVKLHVHLGEDAMQSSHGYAVAISIPGSDLAGAVQEYPDEVQVGLDKFTSKLLKNIQTALLLITAFILLPIICRFCIRQFFETENHPFSLPFAGTPPLRAPPL